MNQPSEYAIIGGGIGGLSLAVALQQKGVTVTVYEQAPLFKPLGAGLALAANAMLALKHIGLDEEIMEAAHVIGKVSIKDQTGKTLTSTDSRRVTKKYGVTGNFTIHRADLHHILVKQLQPGTIKTGKQCTHVEQKHELVTLHFADGSIVDVRAVIACDGIHSPIRKQFLPSSKPRYAGYTCWRGVIDDPHHNFSYEETSETWGPGKRFGIVPLSNNRIYWFACMNAPVQSEAMKRFTTKDLINAFSDFHDPIPTLINYTNNDQLIWGDIVDVAPIKQFAFKNIVLMGDAAHATTPNMGQGACMALEDAAMLASYLLKYKEPEIAFRTFEQMRMARTTKIVNNSYSIGKLAQLENFWLIQLRNLALQMTPASIAEKQIKFLYDISFD